MIASLISFVLFIMIYIMISDIITVLFRMTGLTEEKARFQVISLLTNSGFTTRESEAVVSSKIRRRLARATMLFGYAFTVTIVTTMVNFFVTLGESELNSLLYLLPILAGVLLLFSFIRKSRFFKSRFDKWIEKFGRRIMFGKNVNQVLLVDEYGDMVVAEVHLFKVPDNLRDKPLSESGLREKHNIMILMIKPPDGEAMQAKARTVLKPDDVIMVLGRRKAIKEVFEKV